MAALGDAGRIGGGVMQGVEQGGGEEARRSGYGVVTWNSGGLNAKREAGRQRGDFLLGLWDKGGRLGVMAIQETHCRSDAELCQSVTDMRARMHVIHSPAVDGDARAGVLLVLTHDWEVIESVVGCLVGCCL